jgi:uncharacterized phiE125 gp8 family phage protein
MAGLRLITPPVSEPVTLEEAMAHLRVEDFGEAEMIQGYIKAARSDLDGWLGRMGECLITQTWELIFDQFPAGKTIELPLRPVQSVISVTYTDAGGGVQSMPPSSYVLDGISWTPRLGLAPGASWPASAGTLGSAQIQFVAGYGDNPWEIPPVYRQGLLLMLAHLYEHRGDDAGDVPIPSSYWNLLGIKGRLT